MNTNPDPPLLREVTRLFGQRVGEYCLSGAIAAALGVAAFTAVSRYILGSNPVENVDPLILWRSMDEPKKIGVIFGLIFAFWTPILIGARAACRITTAQIANQEITSTMIVGDMLRFLPSAVLYALVIGLPVLAASSCFFVPGLLIASLFTLIVPIGVNERAGIFSAMRRNFSLIGKVFGGSFLITFLCAVVLAGEIALMAVGIDPLLPSTGFAPSLLRRAITAIPVLLLMVLANVGFTLIYFAARRLENPMAFSATTSQS